MKITETIYIKKTFVYNELNEELGETHEIK